MRKPVDLSIAYRLIGSGPVVLVSSLYKDRPNITPIAWNMPISDEPPMVALEIWRDHFIYKCVFDTGDFVINIPSSDMAETIRKLGSISGSKIDKLEQFGLTSEPSKKIKSPRLKDAIGILECTLHKDKHVSDTYSMVIGDVVYAEAEETAFKDRWMVEKSPSKPLHHLGGNIFCAPDSKLI